MIDTKQLFEKIELLSNLRANHSSLEEDIKKLKEEHGEFLETIIKDDQFRSIEELADVIIISLGCIFWILNYVEPNRIEDILEMLVSDINRKIDRQIDRWMKLEEIS